MSPRGEEEVGGTDGLGAVSGGRAECVGRVENEDGGAAMARAVGISAAAEGTGIVAEIVAVGTLLDGLFDGPTGTTSLTEADPGTDGRSTLGVVTVGAAGPLAGLLVR